MSLEDTPTRSTARVLRQRPKPTDRYSPTLESPSPAKSTPTRRSSRMTSEINGSSLDTHDDLDGGSGATAAIHHRRRGQMQSNDNISVSTKGHKVNGESLVTPDGPKSKDHHTNEDEEIHVSPTLAEVWAEEKSKLVLLVGLYLLQGVPLGLSMGSIPFLLNERLSYSAIGTFSFAAYPYSLKLFWSPIVDAVFWPSFGRRKSWIIPAQTFLCFAFGVLSFSIEPWLAQDDVPIKLLTGIFFTIVLCAATQDIAVDGWALTLLQKKNRAWGSTTQSAGLSLGFLLSYPLFLSLQSPEFSHHYGGYPEGEQIITIGGFLRFWSIIYALATLGLWFFHEPPPPGPGEDDAVETDIKKVYRSMWDVIRRPPMMKLLGALLTAKITLKALEEIAPFRLLSKGYPKEKFAGLSVLNTPVGIIAAIVAGKFASSKTPMTSWADSWVIRVLIGGVALFIIESQEPGDFWPHLDIIVMVISLLFNLFGTLAFVLQGGFFNRIADPAIGGTYSTLLNTISNFGGTWPATLAYFIIDALTVHPCTGLPEGETADDCLSNVAKEACVAAGGSCDLQRDGFPVTMAVMIIGGGALYYQFVRKTAHELDSLPVVVWRVHPGGDDGESGKTS